MLESKRVGRTVRLMAGVAAAGLGLAFPAAGIAGASNATATVAVTPGTLSFEAPPGNLEWNWANTGQGAVLSTDESLDVTDSTGSGAGWNVTLTSTTFANGSGSPSACTAGAPCTLPTNSAGVVTTPTVSCDSDDTGSCSPATDTVSYPYTVPAGTTAPVATPVYSAATGSGMGEQTAVVPFEVTVPAGAYSGNYTSIWTFSLVTGP